MPLRLFVAIYPPLERAVEFSRAIDDLALPPQRRVPPADIHLTTIFIGDRAERELAETTESVAAACAGIPPFRLRPVRLTVLPTRNPRRTVVLECDRPAGILELHDRLVRRFARSPRDDSRRRFLPHLTLARFGGAGAALDLDAPVQLGDFEVDAVHLVASVLRPDGAEHRRLERFELGAN